MLTIVEASKIWYRVHHNYVIVKVIYNKYILVAFIRTIQKFSSQFNICFIFNVCNGRPTEDVIGYVQVVTLQSGVKLQYFSLCDWFRY